MRDFEFTPAWQRHLAPRRGSLGAESFTPRARAAETTEALWAQFESSFAATMLKSDDAVREAAAAMNEDPSQASPLAAATPAMIVISRWDVDQRKAQFADMWIAERGLRFAADAAVELLGLNFGNNAEGIVQLKPGHGLQHNWKAPQVQVALRVRTALATAPDPEYQQIVSDLAAHRSRHDYHRLATSILAPTEVSWVEQDIADAIAAKDAYRLVALTQAISTIEQLERLDAAKLSTWTFDWTVAELPTYVATLTDALGVSVLPVFLRWLDEHDFDADKRRRLLSVVAQMPTEAAMRALADRVEQKFVSPALMEAAERFPALALQVLADCGARGHLAELLRAHVRTHRELAEGELTGYPPQAANRVRALLEETTAVTEAPAQALPSLLVDPPWLNRKKPAKPVVVDGLVCTDEPLIGWLEGEQAAFGTRTPHDYYGDDENPSWEERAEKIARGQISWWEGTAFFVLAPEELARPLLSDWKPYVYSEADDLQPIVARFGVHALPPILRRARQSPATVGQALLPFESPELAVLMADWLTRLKSVRGLAGTWLQRHAASASRALLPPAVGKAGPARRQAENALLYLGSHGHRDAVVEAARSYGGEVVSAIEVLLDRDPLTVLPAKVPVQPPWLQIGLLAPVRLRDGSGALPASAVEHLVTMFALSRMDQPYAGLAVVREAVRPDDLSAFAWGLFQRWYAAGAAAKDNWVLDGLALAGDDAVVRELTPMILAWPGEGGHARAVTGVQVLAAIGTDVALMHLHSIAQRAKFKGLKTAAQDKMSEVADALGLTSEQLADRLVPGLGLAEDGTLWLDYGPRTFVVGFDEQLKPYVTDASGKRLKSLPKPGAKDDAELAPAAYQQFSALKKDVRRVAPDVIQRLERAMVTGRRWSGAEFGQFFVAHPLLWHIVRRLVWGQYDADGNLTGTFRVAEDRTFADSTDEDVTLAEDVLIGVAHPLHLGADVPVWAEVLADYEILQPFPQLAREVCTLTEAEAESGSLERFEGLKVATTRLLGLEKRGWRRDDPMDAGIQGSIDVSFASGVGAGISLDPGIIVGEPNYWEEQTLQHVGLSNRSAWADEQVKKSGRSLPLRPADLVAVSEILRDLTEITAPPN